jgi:hypothetical protein
MPYKTKRATTHQTFTNVSSDALMSTLPDAVSAQQQLLTSAWCASILTVRLFASKSYTSILLEPRYFIKCQDRLLAKYLAIAASDNLITVRREFTAPDTKITEGGKAPTTRRQRICKRDGYLG